MPRNRKLGRPTAHRKAMLRGMVTLLLENGQVETTLTRAKEVRSIAEKMITLGKKNTHKRMPIGILLCCVETSKQKRDAFANIKSFYID